MSREIEESWHLLRRAVRVTGIWKTRIGIPEFVKERVTHGFDRRESLRWGVLEQRRDQINCFRGSFAEDLREGI